MNERRSKSRKRSVASSTSKPPDLPVLFVDRSLGKKQVAGILRRAGVSVEVHDDHFPSNAKDEVWLTEAGKREWVVLTRDERIRYRTLERNALRNAGVAAFILTGKDLNGQEMGMAFVGAIAAMARLLQKQPKPFIAVVRKDSSVKLLP